MAQALEIPPPGFDELSVEEKIEYVGALWTRIAAHPEQVPVPDWHREVLRARLAAHEKGESSVRPWSEVQRDLLAALRTVRG